MTESTPASAVLAADPMRHMGLLIHASDRVLALRLALSQVIRPGCTVLDAGCGALGVLSIMSARLGAARVVGVDFEPLPLAEALAAENGVADRVEFVSGDLRTVALPVDNFDVIVAMVYDNEIGADLAQQRLVAGLWERFGRSDTILVPDRVRYWATGYAYETDSTGATLVEEWRAHVSNAEQQAGVTFGAVAELLDGDGLPPISYATSVPAVRRRRSRSSEPALSRNSLRFIDRAGLTALTARTLFTDVDYLSGWVGEYPSSLELSVVRHGLVELVVWQQDLLFGDLLVRTTESVSRVDGGQRLSPGEVAVLTTDGGSFRRLRLSVP